MKKTILFFFVVIAFVSSAQIPKPTQDTTGTDRSKSAPSTGTVIIKSTPPNCKVYYSGKELGLTPYTFKKKAGNYSFTIETEGYESQTIDVKIKKGKTSDISVSLNKKMTLLDSLLLLSKEMSQIDRMSDESNMNKEEKDIHSFIKQTSEYAKSIENLYTMTIEPIDSTLSIQKRKQSFSLLVLKAQNITNQEKPIVQSALLMITNLKGTDSHVDQGVDIEQLTNLFQLIQDTTCSPISKKNTIEILSLLGKNQLNEAHYVFKSGLLQEKVERRYFVFLSVLKNFRAVGELRLNELLNSK